MHTKLYQFANNVQRDISYFTIIPVSKGCQFGLYVCRKMYTIYKIIVQFSHNYLSKN